MQAKKTIEDPTSKDGFEGMILGTQKMEVEFVPEPFDLHAAARYVREHNLPGIDDEIMRMFAIERPAKNGASFNYKAMIIHGRRGSHLVPQKGSKYD